MFVQQMIYIGNLNFTTRLMDITFKMNEQFEIDSLVWVTGWFNLGALLHLILDYLVGRNIARGLLGGEGEFQTSVSCKG